MSIPKEEENELDNEYTLEDDVLVLNNDHTTESYEEELEVIPESNIGTPRDDGPLFMEQKYDSKNNEIRLINIEDYIQIMPYNSGSAMTHTEQAE